jgi:hypothetical protein
VTPGSSLIEAACSSRFCPAGSSWKVCMVTGLFPPSIQVRILLMILFKKYFADKIYEALGKFNRRIDILTKHLKESIEKEQNFCLFLTGLLNQIFLDFYLGW